ncbi:MAG: VWA domain-containing protein [archaeon]
MSENEKTKQTSTQEEPDYKDKPGSGDKTLNSIAPNDKSEIENGRLINDMINQGVNFTPDLAFESLVKDYKNAERIYGKSLLRKLTGFSAEELKKNISIPEFQRELKKILKDKYEELKEDKLIDEDSDITEKGYKLSTLSLYTEELKSLKAKGFGEKYLKKKSDVGEASDYDRFSSDNRYKDISFKKSSKLAIIRKHTEIIKEDLIAARRKKKGKINIIYAVDSSGSMKGEKLDMAKKGGIALIHHALSNKDKVGLVLFRTDLIERIPPIDDFFYLAEKLTRARAAKETNLTKAILESIHLFTKTNTTKHLILITDAMPTVGDDPAKEALEAASAASNIGITISVVGINLTEKGKELAKEIAEIGKGRLHICRNIEELDVIVLEDYRELAF